VAAGVALVSLPNVSKLVVAKSSVVVSRYCVSDPPPLKWSDLRYVFDIQEDCNGKEAIQA
jgi:hypothetical protein